MLIDRVVVKLMESDAERRAAFELRRRVFVEEQGVPLEEEVDEHDDSATHVVAVAGGRVVGTGRAVFPPQGTPAPVGGKSQTPHTRVKIGRMAVDEGCRRRGVGGRILDALPRLRGGGSRVPGRGYRPCSHEEAVVGREDPP